MTNARLVKAGDKEKEPVKKTRKGKEKKKKPSAVEAKGVGVEGWVEEFREKKKREAVELVEIRRQLFL